MQHDSEQSSFEINSIIVQLDKSKYEGCVLHGTNVTMLISQF